MERETARRLEREAAKLEKLNRKHENISRSTERVSGGRSGSLERRRSGDEGPVLNQSTVHGEWECWVGWFWGVDLIQCFFICRYCQSKSQADYFRRVPHSQRVGLEKEKR